MAMLYRYAQGPRKRAEILTFTQTHFARASKPLPSPGNAVHEIPGRA